MSETAFSMGSESSMQVDWDPRYQQADTPWNNGKPSAHLKSFLAEGKVKPCRVLELGCGTGTNAVFLAQLGFEVTAVDLSPTALKRAREKATTAKVDVNFLEADVTALPDLGGTFPFVFDRGTYHVVRKIDLAGFQKMLVKMVAPSGIYWYLPVMQIQMQLRIKDRRRFGPLILVASSNLIASTFLN